VPPATSNEPIGPGSSVHSESDPATLCAAGVFAYMANLPGYVFHSRAGIYGYAKCCPPSGEETRFENTAGAGSFHRIRTLLPGDLPNWTRNDGLEPAAPFTVFAGGRADAYWSAVPGATDGCVRNTGSVQGQNFLCLPIGIQAGGVTLKARRACTVEAIDPLRGKVVVQTNLHAADSFKLPQGQGFYLLKGAWR
jgi:hypothetical protein